MIKAKLKDYNTCCCCIDEQVAMQQWKHCNKCEQTQECKIISCGHSLFKGDYAMVIVDERIKRVPIDLLINVEE